MTADTDDKAVSRFLGLARATRSTNPKLALASAEKAHALQPGNVDAVEVLGWVLLSTDAPRARRLLESALDAIEGYDDPAILLQKARISSLLGDSTTALRSLEEALRESPSLSKQVERDAPDFFSSPDYAQLLSAAGEAAERKAKARREAARIAKLIPSPQDEPRKAMAWARREWSKGAVKFAKVPPEAFEFYLGGCVHQAFFLSKRHEKRALERLGDPAAAKLEVVFKADELKLRRNERGDIVEIKGLGADIWPFELLEPIADLLKPSSFFVILDDESKFWKVSYEGGRPQHWRGTWQPPPEPPRPRRR